MKIKANNPVLSRIEKFSGEYEYAAYNAATYKGVAKKSFIFVATALFGALLGILMLMNNPQMLVGGSLVIILATFISGFVAFASPRAAKIAGIIYSLFEGMFLGAVSVIFEMVYPGAVLGALLGTVSVALIVSTLYFSSIVKVNGKFVRVLLIAVISFIFTQLIILILNLIFPAVITPLISNFGVQLLFSGIVILIASLYLMFDLEQIRQVVEGGQPKEMEWYVAFGIVYTILWLYIEMLRLVALVLSKRD